jgi:uncharacterized protein
VSTVLVLALAPWAAGSSTLSRDYLLVCLPATIIGAYLGIQLYGWVDDRQFRTLVLWLLLASGLVLMASNLR